jgi:hypothetical protein
MTNKKIFSAFVPHLRRAGLYADLITVADLVVVTSLAVALGSGLANAAVPANDSTMYVHTATQGDTLTSIAKRYLIDAKNWESIRERNSIRNPNAIPVGTQIRIRVAEMRTEPAPVKVLAVQGQVEANGSKIAPGGILKEGDKLKTGENGFVTIQLADGSTINVQSKSTVQLENARQLANTGGVGDSIVKLESGRLETTVAKQRNAASRYEVRTPTSNMGVRGTVFRAGADEGGARALSEVIEGKVAVTSNGVASAPELGLVQGFGTVAEAGKAPLPPIELLPAPQTKAFPAKLDEGNVEFSFPPVAKASKYRGQIARDRAFGDMLADVVSNEPRVKFAQLQIGEYFVRVRAIDNLGLEGNDSTQGFAVQTLLAAPMLVARVNPAVDGSQQATFSWGAVAVGGGNAQGYHLQVAKDSSFTEKLIDQTGLRDTTFVPAQALPPGQYFARVATVGDGGRESVFSAAKSLSIVAPAVAVAPPKTDGANVVIAWDGTTGRAYQVQVALDEYFHVIVVDRSVTGSGLTLDNLSKNLYFIRVREAGNNAAPWSETRNVDVYHSWLNITPRR